MSHQSRVLLILVAVFTVLVVLSVAVVARESRVTHYSSGVDPASIARSPDILLGPYGAEVSAAGTASSVARSPDILLGPYEAPATVAVPVADILRGPYEAPVE
jgi:hypothetical protein